MKIYIRSIAIICLISINAAFASDIDSILIRSVGGAKAVEKLRSLKSYRMTGKINWNGIEGTYEGLFKSPNKVKVIGDFGSFSIEQGFDGKIAWQKDIHGRAFELAGFEKTEFMRTVYFMSFAYVIPDRFPGRFDPWPVIDADSAQPFGVTFYPFENDVVQVRFNSETGYMEHQSARLDNLIVTTVLDDHRKIEGVVIPFYSLSTAKGAPMSTELKIDDVQFDVDIENSLFEMPITVPHDFRFPADSNSITIPFIFNYGHVLIPVTVNGVKKGWFILDTGASATYYDLKFVSDLELTPVGSSPSMGLGGYEQIQLLKMDSLTIGQLVLYDQTAGALPLEQLAGYAQKKTTFGGIIGYDFFVRFPVLFDFKKEKLTIFNPEKFELPDSGIVEPFQLTMMIPTIEAEIAGARGNFVLDMGNALGLIIHKKFGESISDIILADSTGQNSRSILGIGPGVSARPVRVDSMQLDAHSIHIPEAILAESTQGLTGSWEISGNIGTKVLSQYAVLFDYQGQRVVFYEKEK